MNYVISPFYRFDGKTECSNFALEYVIIEQKQTEKDEYNNN